MTASGLRLRDLSDDLVEGKCGEGRQVGLQAESLDAREGAQEKGCAGLLRELFPPRSADWKSKVQAWAGLVPSEG